jgi:hypothetical protein
MTLRQPVRKRVEVSAASMNKEVAEASKNG